MPGSSALSGQTVAVARPSGPTPHTIARVLPCPRGVCLVKTAEVTRSAAAEYPRAVHEPQSPGSAGVPPACGLRSVFRPSPPVCRPWGRNETSWRPPRVSTAARPLVYERTCVWPLLLDQCCDPASLVCLVLRGEPVGDVLYGQQGPYCHHQP